MKTTDIVNSYIERIPKGYIFTYNNFYTESDKKEAVIKALNRMAQSGKLAKLAKGRYYKPESSPFGNLKPSQAQIVKDLLEEDGKITGYLTGLSLYNTLGLTTQVSNVIQIGKNHVRPDFCREQYNISFIRQKNKITRENTPLLQLLDAIRYIKRIPDTNIETSCTRLLSILKNISNKDLQSMVKLSKNYPPATRALFGAMLDHLASGYDTAILLASLNPITKYKLSGILKVLPTAGKWNFV